VKSRLARELLRHERIAKARSNRLGELYDKARDKVRAGRILDMLASGKITYERALKELERLARG